MKKKKRSGEGNEGGEKEPTSRFLKNGVLWESRKVQRKTLTESICCLGFRPGRKMEEREDDKMEVV